MAMAVKPSSCERTIVGQLVTHSFYGRAVSSMPGRASCCSESGHYKTPLNFLTFTMVQCIMALAIMALLEG